MAIFLKDMYQTFRYLSALKPLCVQSLPYETVSSSDKPIVTNQSGSTSVDTVLLKASLPGPFPFLSVRAPNYPVARESYCAPSTTCSK